MEVQSVQSAVRSDPGGIRRISDLGSDFPHGVCGVVCGVTSDVKPLGAEVKLKAKAEAASPVYLVATAFPSRSDRIRCCQPENFV